MFAGIMTRFVFAAVFVVLACPLARAQRDRDTWTPSSPSSFEVSGEVRLADTGQPAGRIPVRLERFGGGIVDQIDTDGSGRFRFPNLPRGYYRVIINAPGYRPMQQDADLQVIFRAHLLFEIARDTSKNMSGIAALTDVIDAKVPADAREEYERGRAAAAKKEYAAAVSHLRKAVATHAQFFSAYVLLATTYMDTRQWADAEQALLRALEIKSDDGITIISLGEVYWREKRYDDAEKSLLAGLKIDDKLWHGHFTLARLYVEQNQIMKAAPEIGRTLQLKPDFAEAHLLAGNILLKLNQRERAIVEYEEYVRLAPKGEFADEARDLIKKLNAMPAR
ncbi:MAG TPA: tetratricopeptide repeat protein [Pyrinomonadaceae bacterium]|jgi:tetratricopeptide (TPR) repeat protein